MSTSPMTTVDRLRQAIADTLSIDAQGLQAAIGQLVVAASADYPAAGPQERSLHSSAVRTTVLLADRIPAGQEAQALAQEIALHHGRQAAQAVIGERAAELLGGDGKVSNYIEHEPNSALEALCQETGTTPEDWNSMDGPETGVGVERWYVHTADGREAYTVDDQGSFTIEVSVPDRKMSNYIEQAPVVLTVTPDELGIVQAAVQEYRELIASPTSADREARGNVWADREVAASDALLDGKLAVAARRFRTSHEVSNYTGFTQDVLNALASEHRMTPGTISVSSDGTKSVVLERDNVDDLYCQAILTVHSSGAVACHTGLYRERAIINNGSVTEPSVEVAIANASAVFDDLIVRHAEVRKEENYQSPGM